MNRNVIKRSKGTKVFYVKGGGVYIRRSCKEFKGDIMYAVKVLLLSIGIVTEKGIPYS